MNRIRPVLLALGVLALAGCSVSVQVDQEVSKENIEKSISDALRKTVGQTPDSVVCPGPVKAIVGQTARCVLTGDGVRYGVTATVKSVDGSNVNYDVKVDDKPMS